MYKMRIEKKNIHKEQLDVRDVNNALVIRLGRDWIKARPIRT